ncbi:MAG: hypothetical protein JWO71_2935 [Candidatus Acidoferrum typicum]|nr:hypothetical protein [Candidatus Acidoferrum typicum]
MDQTSKPSPDKAVAISRREFARRAAIASAVASLAPATALTTPAPPPNEPANIAAADRGGRLSDPSSNTASEQQPADMPKLSPESHAEAEARLQTISSQYGGRFNDPQKADLRRLCFSGQPPLDRLRAYALDNGDNPALYFKPLVEREKNPLESTRVGKTPDAAKKP